MFLRRPGDLQRSPPPRHPQRSFIRVVSGERRRWHADGSLSVVAARNSAVMHRSRFASTIANSLRDKSAKHPCSYSQLLSNCQQSASPEPEGALLLQPVSVQLQTKPARRRRPGRELLPKIKISIQAKRRKSLVVSHSAQTELFGNRKCARLISQLLVDTRPTRYSGLIKQDELR